MATIPSIARIIEAKNLERIIFICIFANTNNQ